MLPNLSVPRSALPGLRSPSALVVHRVTPEEARGRQVDPGIGVQFVHGDDRFRERVDQFLASLSARGTG